MQRHQQASSDRAGNMALEYMAYLASDADKLAAFCDQHSLGATELKGRLADPVFQGFLLDNLLQDESELLAFAAQAGIKPETILPLRASLPGFSE